ncbi:ABC transporter ATP-binding protein [Mesorhizobium sp.]|uniref:ABC transporter ATP-binding protein n=1 Tax=Mesorhizobium sp. TaxID=1871066 RepID=UPI000FE97C28|nr:ABC transporter ATP-binding protein [Mesorhizobium sp.]RWI87925.1 MAG: ABC transporter ATP-binding protein [Mesorhizobium sp.]
MVQAAAASQPAELGNIAAAIEMKNISVDFTRDGNTLRVLRQLDMRVEEESFVALIGPSGSGKSTLLRVIADLIPPSEGQIRIFGKEPAAARINRDIGFVFQDATLLPWRSVIDNVRLPLEIKGKGPQANSFRAEELLELVGLEGRHNAFPHELSGGMRQRVAIARSLICRPRLLLMDEPFGALDEITRDKMNEELLRIWRETQTTIIFVTHSIAEAAYLGERVIVLQANPGQIRDVVDIDFGRDRTPVVRDSTAFVEYGARLRNSLRGHG